VLLSGTFSRYRKNEKKKKKHTNFFFLLLLGLVGTVFDGCGISQPPMCCTGHLFSWGVCLWLFFSEFKVGGWGLTWSVFVCFGVAVLHGALVDTKKIKK
jgi:hypothetical protein